MKKAVTLLVITLFVFGFVLAGCGGAKQEAAQPEDNSQQEAPEKLKVAMLLPGPISDQGWNATAYNGLKLIEENLGAEIAYTENVAQSDFEEVFRGYATQGYDIIFGHGFQFGDAAMKVAPEFPEVKFIITSTDISQAPNVASLNNDNTQQGFLAGVLSALLTESKIVGAVGGMEIPSIKAYMDGFVAGVKYIDPNIKALTTYVGDFKDAAKAKEVALAMINQQADVLNHDADAAGLGVIDAAKAKGVKVLGAISDQYELAPEVMVSSALSDLTLAFEVITKQILEGSFEAKMYVFGVTEGTVGLAPYHDFEDKIPQEVKDKVNSVVEDLNSGKIDVQSLITP